MFQFRTKAIEPIEVSEIARLRAERAKASEGLSQFFKDRNGRHAELSAPIKEQQFVVDRKIAEEFEAREIEAQRKCRESDAALVAALCARKPITRERLQRIKARERATIAGPWVQELDGGVSRSLNDGWRQSISAHGSEGEFLSHAKQDVPDLCAALEDAWAEIERLKEGHERE